MAQPTYDTNELNKFFDYVHDQQIMTFEMVVFEKKNKLYLALEKIYTNTEPIKKYRLLRELFELRRYLVDKKVLQLDVLILGFFSEIYDIASKFNDSKLINELINIQHEYIKSYFPKNKNICQEHIRKYWDLTTNRY